MAKTAAATVNFMVLGVFFSVIFGTARKSAVIMQNEEGSILPVRILKLGWVTWVPSRMLYL